MTVQRILTLPAGAERVWETVVCGDWLGDEAVIAPRPGADGWVREADRLRHLVVESVEPGRRLVFSWWPLTPDGVGPASRVEIDVDADADDEQTRVVVVETPLPGGAAVPDGGPMAMAVI